VNLNKSLADKLNQPTSFPTARSSKNIRKTQQSPKPNKNQKNQWVGIKKKLVFLNPVKV